MQQFTVPQFIEVEAKVIGPITARQFLIFIAAAVLGGVAYLAFDFELFVVVAVILIIIAGAFAFFKINGRPLHFFVLNLIQTLKKPGLRVWNHKLDKDFEEEIVNIEYKEKIPRKEFYNKSRLAELSLVVDTKGQYQSTEDEPGDIQIDLN
ncbi:MAG TPA: PrgI family protein [Patescibacteria group bacterium]|nr:PrgI family protein [Patescibacteria group bacterium]